MARVWLARGTEKITEYGVRITDLKACGRGVADAEKITEYRVQSTDYGLERHKVGAWLRRALL